MTPQNFGWPVKTLLVEFFVVLRRQARILPTLLKTSVSYAGSPSCHPYWRLINLDVRMMLACISSEAWGKVIATKKITETIACVFTSELCEARSIQFLPTDDALRYGSCTEMYQMAIRENKRGF